MDNSFWAKIHGASTHVPLALAGFSWMFDAAGLALARRPAGPQLNIVGYWTMLLAGLGTFPAVASGLLMTKGEILGHDLVLFHHLFVWPAFALLVGLATWRAMVGATTHRRTFGYYLAVSFTAAVLVAGAGYWGGEMLLAN
jgi:uncharacterized membrane protein